MTVVISYLGQLHGHIAGTDPAQNLNVAQLSSNDKILNKGTVKLLSNLTQSLIY